MSRATRRLVRSQIRRLKPVAPHQGPGPGGDRTAAYRLQPAKDGTCRICGCTDEHACDGGCWWVLEQSFGHTVCSSCVRGLVVLAEAPAPDALVVQGFFALREQVRSHRAVAS